MIASTNGDTKKHGPTEFPKDHRRMVPGEVTEKGDLCRDCAKSNTSWIQPELGHLVRSRDQVSFARLASKPVAESVLYRALARFQLFIIEHSYLLENMVTNELEDLYCYRCGGGSRIDEESLYNLVETLAEEDALSDEELLKMDEAEGSDYVRMYETLRVVRVDGENPLPKASREYNHEPGCEAEQMMYTLRSFGEIFGVFVDAKLDGNLHQIADLSAADDGWI